MASIIRSPVISSSKRKLSTRRPNPKEVQREIAASGQVDTAVSQFVDNAVAGTSSSPDFKDLVEQAKLSVLNQFKEEAETARELGRQRGLREGRLTGIDEAKRDFTTEFDRIRSITDKLQKVVESGNVGLEDMAVAIAFEAVCKVLGKSMATYDGIQALVREAASHVRGSKKVVVRLHKSDLAILKNAGALDGQLPSGAKVSWVADKSVDLGGCLIETDVGELDARLETQLERLRMALLAVRQTVTATN